MIASMCWGSALAGADDDRFGRGLSAFNTADYATALAIWRPLAERDEPRAEAGIGFMTLPGTSRSSTQGGGWSCSGIGTSPWDGEAARAAKRRWLGATACRNFERH